MKKRDVRNDAVIAIKPAPRFRLRERTFRSGETDSGVLFFLCFRFLARSWIGHRILATWPVDQFNQAHLGTVPTPGPPLDNPRVPAVAVGVPRTDLVEQLRHNPLVCNGAQHLAAGMQISSFRKGDQALGSSPEFLCSGGGRIDGLVFDQGGDHVAEHCLQVAAIAVQFGLFIPVSHFFFARFVIPARPTPTGGSG